MRYIKTYKIFESKNIIDEITKAYIEAALWTSEADDYDIDDIDDNIKKEMKESVEYFVHIAGDYFSDLTNNQIGYDFWLTRNGHGAGFWDRDYINDEDKKQLTAISEILGSADFMIPSEDYSEFEYYDHDNNGIFKYVLLNDIESMKKYIDNDGDINITNNAGETLLFFNNGLDHCDSLDMKILLIDNGIDMNITNIYNKYFYSELYCNDEEKIKELYPEKYQEFLKKTKTQKFNL